MKFDLTKEKLEVLAADIERLTQITEGEIDIRCLDIKWCARGDRVAGRRDCPVRIGMTRKAVEGESYDYEE